MHGFQFTSIVLYCARYSFIVSYHVSSYVNSDSYYLYNSCVEMEFYVIFLVAITSYPI